MKSLNVLVVDDDVDFAEALTDVLESEGCQVDLCHTGEDAVARFREKDYDLSFMDVKLPKKNGVESFLEIKAMKPDSKVVMMTGFSLESLLKQAEDSGAWAVLEKPLEMNLVMKLVQGCTPVGVVLVADDDVDFSRSLEELLRTTGYTVRLASNGSEALEQIAAGPVDLLILDLRMPVLSGSAVYEELLRQDYQIPTLVVTGYSREEEANLASLRGQSVAGVFEKPLDTVALMHLVQKLTPSPAR